MTVAEGISKQISTSHSHCFACGTENKDGLGLVFKECGNGHAVSYCMIDNHYQGYPGVIQGGIVATIMDCAMTNCLFLHGIEAMTARLNVEFHKPLLINETMKVEAVLAGRRGKVCELTASITQSGKVKASASARFMMVNDNGV